MSTSTRRTERSRAPERPLSFGGQNSDCEEIYYPAKRGDREPTHPGAVIGSALEELPGKPTLRAVGGAIGISHEQVRKIISKERPVTAEYDLLFCRYFGMKTTGIFLRMQHAYDMWHAEKKLKKRLAQILPAERE